LTAVRDILLEYGNEEQKGRSSVLAVRRLV